MVTLEIPAEVTVLALAAAITRVIKTITRTPHEAIGIAASIEVGLLVGAVLHGAFPGAYALGGTAGLILGAVRWNGIRGGARTALLRRVKRTPDAAGALLVLQDRSDYLSDSIREVTAPWGIASDLLILLVGITLVWVGLGFASPLVLIGGTLSLFPPLIMIARYVIQAHERWRVNGMIDERAPERSAGEVVGAQGEEP